jgi:uroporphyrinogen-III decarboxylase
MADDRLRSKTTRSFEPACASRRTYTPIWLMRQAGRYLPEYKALRSRAGSFMGLATNPRFATEVTLQPLDRFALDAAILFSDILTVPDAMGLGLQFAKAKDRASSGRSATRAMSIDSRSPTWTACATSSMPSQRSDAH